MEDQRIPKKNTLKYNIAKNERKFKRKLKKHNSSHTEKQKILSDFLVETM